MSATSGHEAVAAGSSQVSPSATMRQRRRRVGAMVGSLLGAWWAIWVVGAAFAEQMLWEVVPGEAGQDRAVGLLAFARFAADHGLSRTVLLLSGILLFIIVGTAAGYALAGIGQWLRLDPEQHSRRALFDMLAQWRPALVWAAPFLVGIAITSFHDFRIGSMDASTLIVAGAFALVLLTPFLVYDRRVLERPSPRRIWVPRWPGWRVVLAGIVIGMVNVAVATLVDVLRGAIPGAALFPIELLAIVFDIVIAAFLCMTWIDRKGFGAFALPFKSSHARSTFGPLFALSVRVGVVGLWLLPIIVVPALLTIFVVPGVESTLARLQLPAPPYSALLRVDYLTLGFGIGCALNPILAFATGRTYVLSTPIRPGS